MIQARSRLALLALGLLFGAFAASAAEPDAVARTEAYLEGLETLSAEFVQVVRDREGRITDRATGSLYISRPDRFRWEYRDPYLQTIVADGRRLWLYDAELEQVTVRALEAGLGSTPAMLLSGSGRVGDGFEAVAVQPDGGLTWCRLKPRETTSDFESVSLAFAGTGERVAMQLEDKLGQSTEIGFNDVRRNAVLDKSLFRFEPPPGADVIGDAGP
jgi:outer membrane lipoprotein carrier protein